jgi:hypothetical protein
MTHDYIRNGTTTLFAALNVVDATVTGQCIVRHHHQEFIRFLNRIGAAVPAGRLIRTILDNYGAHKHPKVRAWLPRHPRLDFPFHSDSVLLGQYRRRLLHHPDTAVFAARRFPFARSARVVASKRGGLTSAIGSSAVHRVEVEREPRRPDWFAISGRPRVVLRAQATVGLSEVAFWDSNDIVRLDGG